MIETTMNNVSGMARDVSDLYQLVALTVVCVCGIVALWLYTKKGLARNCDAELARTAQRKAERDRELTELRSEIRKGRDVADDVGKSLDRHLECHKESDDRMQRTFDRLDRTINTLQTSVHEIDKGVTEIRTIVKEKFKMRGESRP
ncbi:MAG: hypothetical protein LBU70_04990 [Chitinispirillales bacterium]|jgi:DNA anti-recombination protein RmuC|nr:hypothetical protein [Chitinispirillales bacterium]